MIVAPVNLPLSPPQSTRQQPTHPGRPQAVPTPTSSSVNPLTMAASASTPALGAAYTSPTAAKNRTFSTPLPPTADKTAYLSALRSSVVQLQTDVNAFLTQRMDEDKQASAANGAEVDDAKEEENYGEEVVDDED